MVILSRDERTRGRLGPESNQSLVYPCPMQYGVLTNRSDWLGRYLRSSLEAEISFARAGYWAPRLGGWLQAGPNG